MPGLELREPLSAATHALGAALALPAAWVLWRQGRGDRGRQLSLLIFAIAMLACYTASAAFHATPGPAHWIHGLAVADRVGIYLLIAGTYTPIAWNLLDGRWRAGTLSLAWAGALAGGCLHVAVGLVSPWVSTVLYLGMGWGAVCCIGELSRRVHVRTIRLIVLGGILYSVGALINLARWPDVLPGVFGYHEIFHVFVLAGSLAHFTFVFRVAGGVRSERRFLPVGKATPPRPKFLSAVYRRRRVR